MKFTRFFVVAFVFFHLSSFFLSATSNAAVKGTSALLTDQQVERHDLTRAWFNQVEIDPMRHNVLFAVEEGGTLFIVSDDAKLHAINSETGQSLWKRQFGERGMDYQEPAVNSRMVAVMNGLEVFVFNRKNGKLLFQARLPGAAATPCEISEHYLYIPLLNDRIIAFPLDDFRIITEDEATSAKPAASADETDATKGATIVAANKEKEDDSVLDNIVRSFEATRRDLLAQPIPPKKEPEIVLQGPLGIPLATQTFGNVLSKPVVPTQTVVFTKQGRPLKHQEIVIWVTDRGAFMAAGIENFSQETLDLRYMVDSNAESFYMDSTRVARREWSKGNEIASRPTPNQSDPFVYTDNKAKDLHIPSLVVAGNQSGYVFAVKDRVGEVLWRFSANGAIKERIAVIGTDVYCPVFPSGLHALDLLTGREKWFARGITKFIAASKKRLYLLDNDQNLVVLNRETGVPITSFSVRSIDQFFFNLETDRIFAVNKSGLIQCLKERKVCGDPSCRGKEICPHSEVLAQPVFHRLTCKQYDDVMKGSAEPPKLYWLTTAEKDEKPSETPEAKPEADNEDPFAAPTKKKSGEDGGLAADEGGEEKPKAEKPAEKPKTEDDPFQ